MPKALSLFLPMWSIDLAKRRRRIASRRKLPSNASPDSRARPLKPTRDAFVLVRTVANRQVIASCCARAASCGVRVGMTLAHARALVTSGHLVAQEHTPARDRAALARFAEWATRFSPAVAVDASGAAPGPDAQPTDLAMPDGLMVDIAGCEHLFGGDAAILDAVAIAVERRGFLARAAVAPTFGAAWALARFGRDSRTIVPHDQLRTALSPLPAAALRLPTRTIAQLAEVGVRTIGELLAIPRGSLPSRFGPELTLRIDQCLGWAVETIDPVRPRPPLRVDLEFGGPTTRTETIDRAVVTLLDRLARRLEERGAGLRRLEITFGRVDAQPVGISIDLSHPSRDPAHLWSLLRPRVERVNLGFGVERLDALASRLGRIRHEQNVHPALNERGLREHAATPRPHEQRLGELTDTLVNRLGAERVLSERPLRSHRPERAILRRSVMESAPAASPRRSELATCSDGDVFGDRPSILFDRPDPADVVAMTPDGPPSWIRWRRQELAILRGIGPERIGGEWWRTPLPPAVAASGSAPDPSDLRPADPSSAWKQELQQRQRTKGLSGSKIAGLSLMPPPEPAPSVDMLNCTEVRDYFKVQDQHGRWLWLFRESESGRWFVHGIWA